MQAFGISAHVRLISVRTPVASFETIFFMASLSNINFVNSSTTKIEIKALRTNIYIDDKITFVV